MHLIPSSISLLTLQGHVTSPLPFQNQHTVGLSASPTCFSPITPSTTIHPSQTHTSPSQLQNPHLQCSPRISTSTESMPSSYFTMPRSRDHHLQSLETGPSSLLHPFSLQIRNHRIKAHPLIAESHKLTTTPKAPTFSPPAQIDVT